MSCPEFHLVFAALAQRDIDDILAYTIETWGAAQLEKYKRILDIAFRKLERNPNIGKQAYRPISGACRREAMLFSTGSMKP